MALDLDVIPAGTGDVRELVRLRDDLAEWMLRRNIRQWSPGDWPATWIAADIQRGEVFVVKERDVIIAAVTIAWDDPLVWGQQPATAGYIHRLMVDRRHENHQLGLRLLGWAEDRVRATGRALARLDCVESNERLRRYYENAGYRAVGSRDFSDLQPDGTLRPAIPTVTLFEKAL